MRRISLLLIATAIILLVPTAVFANIGTPAGTVFMDTAQLVWHTASGGVFADTGIHNEMCTGVYSESFTIADTTMPGDVGQTIQFDYTLYNSGNATDSYFVRISQIVLENGADSWDVSLVRAFDDSVVYNGIAGTVNFTAFDDSITTNPLASDASETFGVWVAISPLLANSPNLSSCSAYIAGRSHSYADTQEYTGYNGNDYAIGGASMSDMVMVWVLTATISLSKGGTVALSPVNDLPVPGAVIEYVLHYNNTGGSATDTAVLYDNIPANTTLYDTAYSIGPKATITGDPATGWQEQYTDLAAPNHAWDNMVDWTTDVTALPGGGTSLADVRWIRWVRYGNGGNGIAPGEERMLGLRVTID